MPKQNAKYAFYFLLSLVALVFMALSVGMIVYSIIDKTVPDVLNNFAASAPQLKFAISALFIAAPIFYVLTALIRRGLKKGELEKDAGVRRWLTYFIIFISSLVVLGVLISVINAFLSGELTGRFIYKALTVFVIAGAALAYYFYDIKSDKAGATDPIIKIFFWASLVIVVAAFVASWFFVESPTMARDRRLDQTLMNNIANIESAVNNYYDRYKKLPDNLTVLTADSNIYLDTKSLTDPATAAPIVYQKTGNQNFQLCATFRLDSSADNYGQPVGSYPGSKNHKAGYQCVNGVLYAVPAKAAN